VSELIFALLQESNHFRIEQQNNAISDYAALLDAWGSVSNMKISAGRCLRRVMGEIENKLAPILNNRNALLHSTNTLDEKVAKNLLDFGVKRFSHLGKFCPVTIHENGLINPSNFGNVTIQCGDYVYFVKDKLEASFHVNPSLYISQTHIQPVLASNCCIVGNPKSGKSALAEALARELDAIPLTVTLILQTILDGNENTALFEKVCRCLCSSVHRCIF
jgi:adenylate/nucleoside-diphosphate kinase